MSKDSIKLVKDYRCPECKCYSDNPRTLVERTEAEIEGLDSVPYYLWVETHKCFNCETIYKFENAT